MLSTAIYRAYKKKIERGYDFLCWAIDLHGTIIVPSYDKDEEEVTLYDGAVEALEHLSASCKHRLILWTSTHPHKYDSVLDQMSDMGIDFDYINENPEFQSTDLCDFSEKFAFDLLVDDKAGFSPEYEWGTILNATKLLDRGNIVWGDKIVSVERCMMESIERYAALDMSGKTAMISNGKLTMNGKFVEDSHENLVSIVRNWFEHGTMIV